MRKGRPSEVGGFMQAMGCSRSSMLGLAEGKELLHHPQELLQYLQKLSVVLEVERVPR